MLITPFLQQEAFDPDLIDAMSAAFTEACATLRLSDRADSTTEIVARHIIELAERGIRTRGALYSQVMKEF